MIDTHTHLYLPEFTGEDVNGGIAAVDRALANGVSHMIFPNVDLSTVEPMLKLHAARPEATSVAMGFHPTEVSEGWRDSLAEILERGGVWSDFVAVGEIGVDLYWEKKFESQQMQAFEQQVGWADKYGLPVIIHCREALPQTLEVMSGFPGVRAVMHSFGGTVEDIEAIRRTGDYYFGINGIVTFKNSKLRDVLEIIGIDRILLETDSPYLAPVPYRGKRNESAYIPAVNACIANSLGMKEEETDRITTENAVELFRLGQIINVNSRGE